MALRLLPDTEALVIAYLKAQPSVVAMAAQRIATKVNAVLPSLRVSLITGREIVREYLDESHVQIDAYADDSVEALLLARTTRAVLLAAPNAEHTRGVVTHVRTINPPFWSPDTTNNDQPRYITEMGLVVHPHPL